MPPSLMHEALLRLFRNRPRLAPEILEGALGVALPAYQEARIESAELTEVSPVEYDADLVVLLVDDRPVHGIVVEVQLSRDSRKRWTWPYYVSALRARLEVAVTLLVVCPDDALAAWCGRPIDLDGMASVVVPVALGPRCVPVVTDLDEARGAPELAVLSAMAHGAGDSALEVGTAAARAVAALDVPESAFYTDIVLSALNEAARRALEELMTEGGYEFQSDFLKKHYVMGVAEGKADAVVSVLAARGLEVSAEVEATIRACRDLGQLETWLRAAVTTESADGLLT